MLSVISTVSAMNSVEQSPSTTSFTRHTYIGVGTKTGSEPRINACQHQITSRTRGSNDKSVIQITLADRQCDMRVWFGCTGGCSGSKIYQRCIRVIHQRVSVAIVLLHCSTVGYNCCQGSAMKLLQWTSSGYVGHDVLIESVVASNVFLLLLAVAQDIKGLM